MSMSSGMAVISLLLSETLTCAKVIAFSPTQALTICTGLSGDILLAARTHLPSMLTLLSSVLPTRDDAQR